MIERRSRYGIVALLLATPSAAADRVVSLVAPAPVTKDAESYPRIAAPVDAAERGINAQLARLDERLRRAMPTCRNETGGHNYWGRGIITTMHGPRFLSFMVSDDVDCGGPHPSLSTSAIVYDLMSGKPVDWTKLLPPRLTGKVALTTAADEMKFVTLQSPRLLALFRRYYSHHAKGHDEQQCLDAATDTGTDEPPAMTVWLDSKAGALVIQHDLAHVVQVCADPVVIPGAVLRAEGASPVLLSALAAARAARR